MTLSAHSTWAERAHKENPDRSPFLRGCLGNLKFRAPFSVEAGAQQFFNPFPLYTLQDGLAQVAVPPDDQCGYRAPDQGSDRPRCTLSSLSLCSLPRACFPGLLPPASESSPAAPSLPFPSQALVQEREALAKKRTIGSVSWLPDVVVRPVPRSLLQNRPFAFPSRCCFLVRLTLPSPRSLAKEDPRVHRSRHPRSCPERHPVRNLRRCVPFLEQLGPPLASAVDIPYQLPAAATKILNVPLRLSNNVGQCFRTCFDQQETV